MSDYRRLVSYIYAYPGGVRDRNVGFAKAEVRGGQFKLSVSLKGVYTDAPETFGVYLMVEHDPEVEGRYMLFPLGNVIVSGGMGQYNDLLNPENIRQSGYVFSDISGIAVARQDNRYYMMFSLWEDGVADPEKVYFAPSDFKKTNKSEEGENSRVTEGAGSIAEEAAIKQEEGQQPEEAQAQEEKRQPEEAKAQEEKRQPEEAKAQEEKQQPEEAKAQEEKQQPEEAQAQEEKRQPEETKAQEEKRQPEEVKAQEERQQPEKQQVQGERQQTEAHGRNGTPQLLQQAAEELVQAACAPQKQECSSQPDDEDDGFEKLFKKADFINAFDDDYYYDCVEVSPEMLKTLPIEEEAIVSNSFLLHGYYNFRHLLFGKVRQNANHTKYFIGVPGMYCNRERFMASMFGFNNFKKSHRSDYTNPYFGYWYQEI